MLRRLLAPLLLSLVLLAPLAGLAQHTGGSFGGSHFGGGGGGHFGGGGFGGGGHFGGFGGYHSYGHAYGGGAPSEGEAAIFIIVGFAIFFAFVIASSGSKHRPDWDTIDVTAVRIAVDGRSRAFLQAELAKIARKKTRTQVDLLRSLRRVIVLLRKCDAAWIYVGVANRSPSAPAVGERTFRELANDARAAFSDERVRNVNGVLVLREGAEQTPRASEGEGVALVTLVVAAKREIRDARATKHEVHAVLDDLESLYAMQLAALEVVWMPADANDRISTATLEALVPGLTKLDDALGGLVHCAHCRGPYAAEIPTCPHCGAPGASPAASAAKKPAPPKRARKKRAARDDDEE